MTLPRWRAAFLLLVLASARLPAEQAPPPGSYADWLLAHGQIERAQGEFLRALWQASTPPIRDSLRLKVAVCLRLQQDVDGLEQWVEREEAETGSARYGLALELGLACMEDHRYARAVTLLASASQGEGEHDVALLHLGRAQACLLNRVAADSAWQAISPASPVFAPAEHLRLVQQNLAPPRHRSPMLGGILAIVPGLGYAFAGHPQTALSALVVLGTLGWATERSLAAANPGLGAFCGFIAGGWYAGSIYGSVQATHQFNSLELDTYQHHFK